MTQADVLKEVIALVLTLPDQTRLAKHSLSEPYCSVRILSDGSYKADITSKDLPKAIRTVGDLRTIPFHVLVSYPRIGLKKLTHLMANLAEENGIDVTFARSGNIIPTDQKMRIVHALHHGYAVVYDQCELSGSRGPEGSTKLFSCHVAYEHIDGRLVSTRASEAYNGQPGNKAGIGGSWINTDLFKHDGKIEGKSSYVLTEKGRKTAEALWGKTPKPADNTIVMTKPIKSHLEDGRYIPDTSTDLADRLARMADRERRLERRVTGNGRGDKMSNILSEAENEIRMLRKMLNAANSTESKCFN